MFMNLIHSFNNQSTKLGDNIDGEAVDDRSGFNVSLSLFRWEDWKMVAIGALF